MSARVACTIVANNYLAYARVFAESFLAHNPDGKVYVLVVDRRLSGIRYDEEPFTALFADEIDIPLFSHLAFRYSVLELSTAVKPWLLRYLHRTEGLSAACYFDPDILVTADLGELYGLLGRNDLVLTPHILQPIEDQSTPSERDILVAGIYNLGFLGLRFNQRTLPFLDWWQRRLYRECLHAVELGLFVDQRWMDLAPAFMGQVAILRDPGYNVAYWNLMHRYLSWRDGRAWIGSVPLRFFHFSGFEHDRPDAISRFQKRFTLEERTDVRPLFDDYQQRLERAQHRELVSLPYAFTFFADGTPVPPIARRLLQELDPRGRRWPDPFAGAGEDSYLAWLLRSEPPDQRIRVPRVALAVWEQRVDLRQVFPDPQGRQREDFARWFAEHAHEHGCTGRFTREVAVSLGTPAGGAAPTLAEMQRHVDASLASCQPLELHRLSAHYVASLNAEAGGDASMRPRITQLALLVHRQRGDLQLEFPDPLGDSRDAFAQWFSTFGRFEYQLPSKLVKPVLRTLPRGRRLRALLWWQRLRRLPWESQQRPPRLRLSMSAWRPLAVGKGSGPGVSIIGWAAAPTGVGEACRNTLVALQQAGEPYGLWSLGRSASDDFRSGSAGGVGGDGLPYDILLFHVNADMMGVVSSQLPQVLLAGRYRIGVWFWEISHFPLVFAGAFRYVDEVWAPSRFCADAFRASAPVPVHFVAPCVPPPRSPAIPRRALGVGRESFLLLNTFDALSVPDRKNPFGLLDAFEIVVRRSARRVHLVLKVNHLVPGSSFDRALRQRVKGLPVTLLARELKRAEVDAFTATCDAYVSLHRSEGLGLPLIEASYLGKPVVATAYGGVTDFLDETTGWVVRHSLVALSEPRGPYPAGAVWADPDVEDAADQLLAVIARPQEAAARAAKAKVRVQELYSPEAAARRFARELARIRGAAAASYVPPATAAEPSAAVFRGRQELSSSVAPAVRARQ